MRRRNATMLFGIFLWLLSTSCLRLTHQSASGTLHSESNVTVQSCLDSLATQIVQNTLKKSPRKIAIVDFTDLRGNITDFGKYVAEKLITNLFLTRQFDIIERSQVSKLFRDYNLTLNTRAAIDSLRRRLGVDVLVTGTFTDLGSTVSVNARLIGTESGTIFGAAGASFPKDDVLVKLLQSKRTYTKTWQFVKTRLENLAKEMVEAMLQGSPNRIAVVDFSNLEGDITDFGRFVAEQLITDLFLTGKFEIIERSQLRKLMEESELTLDSPDLLTKLRKELKVDVLVTGTFTDLGNQIDVNARMIGTESGTIFGVASAKLLQDSVLAALAITGLTKAASGELTYSDPKVFECDVLKIKIVEVTASHWIYITLIQTNKTTEPLRVYVPNWDRDTYLIDNLGKRYQVWAIRDLCRHYYDAENFRNATELLPGIPMRAELWFDEPLNENATSITLIMKYAVFYADHAPYDRITDLLLTVSFTNVPLKAAR